MRTIIIIRSINFIIFFLFPAIIGEPIINSLLIYLNKLFYIKTFIF